MRRKKNKKKQITDLGSVLATNQSSVLFNGGSLLTGSGTGIGTTTIGTTTTTTNITLNPSSNLYIGGGSSLFFSVNEVCDLKSLIVEKKINLKSIIRENSHDLFEVKKIKMKKRGMEFQCEKKIDTSDIDTINSKSSFLSEIIDVKNDSDLKSAAIKKMDENPLLSWTHTGNIGTIIIGGTATPNTLSVYPGTISISNYDNIVTGNANGISYYC